ncbi:MAG: hypothetical protein WBF58_22510 [Xanthobacteraceae bacterium]
MAIESIGRRTALVQISDISESAIPATPATDAIFSLSRLRTAGHQQSIARRGVPAAALLPDAGAIGVRICFRIAASWPTFLRTPGFADALPFFYRGDRVRGRLSER